MVGTIEILDNQVLSELENLVKAAKIKIRWSEKKTTQKVNGTASAVIPEKDFAEMTDAELKAVLVVLKAQMAEKTTIYADFEDSTTEGLRLASAIWRVEKLLRREPIPNFSGSVSKERGEEMLRELQISRNEWDRGF